MGSEDRELKSVVRQTKADVRTLKTTGARIDGPRRPAAQWGKATVQSVIAMGRGCVCDVVVRGNIYLGAECPTALLTVGDSVMYGIRPDESMELFGYPAAALSSGGATETTIVYAGAIERIGFLQ
jgi:hypothetical protein